MERQGAVFRETGDIIIARSGDGGRSFSLPRTVNDDHAETGHRFDALTVAPDGRIAVFFRDIFGDQIRDHALVRVGSEGAAAPVQASHLRRLEDRGLPAPRTCAGGGLRRDLAPGLVDRSGPVGAGRLLRPGASRLVSLRAAPHRKRRLVLAWLDYPTGQGARVMASSSEDGGRSWSAPRALLATVGGSDHPQLAVSKQEIYLTWFTEKEGFRASPVPGLQGG